MTIDNYSYCPLKYCVQGSEIPVYQHENGFCISHTHNKRLNRLRTEGSIIDASTGILALHQTLTQARRIENEEQ